MKTLLVLVLVLVGLVVLGVATTYEVPLNLLLGWVPFLYRTLPRLTADPATVAVSATALVLFGIGAHLAGRWLRIAGGAWKARWSLAGVAIFFLMFAAGTCLIGITHQIAWLCTDNEPLLGETLNGGGMPGSSRNNMRQLTIAISGYESAGNSTFPPGGTVGPDGRLLHGWEVQILPYIPYSIAGIDFTVPWNDPKNAPYFRSVVPTFINPELRPAQLTDADGFGLSHYAANGRVMGAGKAMKTEEITDGTANTLLFGEVNANYRPWGHPVNGRDPARGINKSPHGFGGTLSSGGANFAMADGSVRFVSERVSPAVLRALSTPAGGEAVDLSSLESPP